MVQHACAEHLIPCTLELGGKSPQIVFDDADFDAAVPIVCKAIVQNTGQTCSAGSRVLVQSQVYDDFMGAVAKEFTKLRAGTPEMDLDCGPVINAKQRGPRAELHRQCARGRHSGDRRRADRARRTEWRLLCDADAVRKGAARQPAGAGGGLRPGARGLPLHGRGRCDQAGELDRLRARRCGLDQGWRPPAAASPRRFAPARSSSTAMALAAASNCPSAAPARAAMAARRALPRWRSSL